MNDITVTITGAAHTGKITIAEVVYRALKDLGFDISMEGERIKGNFDKMFIHELKGKTRITVKQMQTQRPVKENRNE